MDHGLIDALGGTTAVAKKLEVGINTVSNWRHRGIAWKYRPAIARLAEQQGIQVPSDFLDPEAVA